MADLVFHYDFLSPYAYIAWTQIHALAERNQREVKPVATLLPALLKYGGATPPVDIPNKRTYAFNDVLRTARVLGLYVTPPPTHPFNAFVSLRVCSLPHEPATLRRIIDAFFKETWGGGRGVESAETVTEILNGLELPGAALVARAQSAEGKDALRANTDAASKNGVFGVPTMLADGELFFGYDSFGHLEAFLRGAPRPDPEQVERWARVKSSVVKAT